MVAVIPARRGSKRVPQKNRLVLGGKSLLSRAIECIESSNCIDRTILSTNDPDLALEAAAFSNLELEDRPEHLAGDDATTEAAISDLVSTKNLESSTIVLLQLTSPFRTAGDITALIGKMRESGASSGVTVSRWRSPPSRPFGPCSGDDVLGPGPELDYPAIREVQNARWAVNGAVYVFTADYIKRTGKLYDENSAIHVMENWRAIDIDYPDDVEVARAIAEFRKI